MQNSKTLVKSLIIAMVLTLSSISAQAGEGFKNLFINIKSTSHSQSGMGLAVANAMQGAGVKTTVLLGGGAINYALKEGGQSKFGPMDATQRDMISSLIKKGGKVMVCGMFAKFAKMKQSDIVKGAKIVDGSEVAGVLLAPSTQTLSF